jgi:hypothetical protein
MRSLTPPAYPIDVLTKLAILATQDGSAAWDRQTNEVKIFKSILMRDGQVLQNSRCAWCSLLIGEVGHRRIHRDHIAPKALYGRWSYNPLNLVLTCDYCNTEIKKTADTVKKAGSTYELSQFYVVHPYLDGPIAGHITFVFDPGGKDVFINGVSDKGRWTVSELRLDSPALTTARARELCLDDLKESLTSSQLHLVTAALSGLPD